MEHATHIPAKTRKDKSIQETSVSSGMEEMSWQDFLSIEADLYLATIEAHEPET